jgi:hypothetical protein
MSCLNAAGESIDLRELVREVGRVEEGSQIESCTRDSDEVRSPQRRVETTYCCRQESILPIKPKQMHQLGERKSGCPLLTMCTDGVRVVLG